MPYVVTINSHNRSLYFFSIDDFAEFKALDSKLSQIDNRIYRIRYYLISIIIRINGYNRFKKPDAVHQS